MPIFKSPDAVTAMVDLMVAYIEISFPEVEVIAGLWPFLYACMAM